MSDSIDKDPYSNKVTNIESAKKSAPDPVAVPDTDNAKRCYHIAAVLAMYLVDGTQKQRHMNIMFESPTPDVSQALLAQLQQAAMTRLKVENGVELHDIKDIVFLNISLLGYMSPDQFHDVSQPSAT